MSELNPIYSVSSIKSFANQSTNDPSTISSYTNFETQIDFEVILISFLSQKPPPYELTVPLDVLLTSRPKPNGTIPRPKNSFMLFREDYNARIKALSPLAPNMTVGKTSLIASKAWKQQPTSVLQFFEVLSMVASQRHKAMYPDYKFTPQRKIVKKGDPFILVNCSPSPEVPKYESINGTNSINGVNSVESVENIEIVDGVDKIDGIKMTMDTSIESFDTFALYENFTFDENSFLITYGFNDYYSSSYIGYI